MTNEDAIKNIRVLHCGDYDCQLPENEADDPDFWCNSTACAGCFHFLCYTALREQVERDKGCNWCIGFCPDVTGDIYADYHFCPMCGRPLKEAPRE